MLWTLVAQAEVTAAPASACSDANVPAHVVKLVAPTYSDYMKINHKEGIVDIRVFLAPSGSVTRAEVSKSSGDAFLDGATYDAAIATTYAAEISNCVAVSGSYIYRTHYRATSTAASPPTPSVTPSPAPIAKPSTSPSPRATTYATTKPVEIHTTYPTTYPTTIATTVPLTLATTEPTTAPTTVPGGS